MLIRLIRSATLRLEYAGHRLLVDPCFCVRHTRPSYAGISANPTVDLPCSPAEALAGVEATLISHLHSDHFDPAAREMLPLNMPILCQPSDIQALRDMGFQDLLPVQDSLSWNGLSILRTSVQHGSGPVLEEMGEASGFLLRAEGEPSLYWAGDTVWCSDVDRVLQRARPDVVIVHAAGALWEGTLIVMDAAQVMRVCDAAPWSTVIATHLEAYDHGTVTREFLRDEAARHGVPVRRLLIPRDGEVLELDRGALPC